MVKFINRIYLFSYMRFAHSSVGTEDPYLDGEKLGSDIVSQLRSSKPVLSILFTTLNEKAKIQGLLNGIKSKLDIRTLIGCTSCGNIIDDEMVDSGSVMLSLYSTRFSVGFAVEQDIARSGFKAGKSAISSALSQLENLEAPTAKMKRFVLMLPDGLSEAEEDVIEGIRSVVGMHTPIVGGSSGDSLRMQKAYQICQGKIYTDAVALAFIQTIYNFGFVSHHGWVPTNKTAFVTKAGGRLIEELNNESAVDVYARMIGESVAKLKKEDFTSKDYFKHPLAERDLGGDYWLKYPRDIRAGKLEVFSDVAEGTALTLMRFDEETPYNVVDSSVNDLNKQVNFPGCIIVFNSIGRREILGAKAVGELKRLKESFLNVPVVGVYTIGQQGYTRRSISGHRNHTFNLLCIGSGRHERFGSGELESMLNTFGLPSLEAKLYSVLLDVSPCTVKRLHEMTSINYAKLYDVVDHLQHKGLVTVSPFRPKKIYAKELSEGLVHLFKQIEKEHKKEHEKRLEILNNVSRGKYREMLETQPSKPATTVTKK